MAVIDRIIKPGGGKLTKGKNNMPSRADLPVGQELNFAASEAYRLLRTNLMFALPDERKCRIIGVSSAVAGEGKSTTALNLAYMLAEADQNVLLIEADMRLPTISRRLNINPKPGLSNLLAGMNTGEDAIRKSGIEERLYIVPAGDVPPNPSELLGSEHMKVSLNAFAETANFIIMDLPPITEVADALVASRLADGIIMVVRQNYTNRRSVTEAMRQLEQANAKVLGFVMTDASTQKKWGYQKSYNGYYKKYGYRKGYYRHGYYAQQSYAEAAREAADKPTADKRS